MARPETFFTGETRETDTKNWVSVLYNNETDTPVQRNTRRQQRLSVYQADYDAFIDSFFDCCFYGSPKFWLPERIVEWQGESYWNEGLHGYGEDWVWWHGEVNANRGYHGRHKLSNPVYYHICLLYTSPSPRD